MQDAAKSLGENPRELKHVVDEASPVHRVKVIDGIFRKPDERVLKAGGLEVDESRHYLPVRQEIRRLIIAVGEYEGNTDVIKGGTQNFRRLLENGHGHPLGFDINHACNWAGSVRCGMAW